MLVSAVVKASRSRVFWTALFAQPIAVLSFFLDVALFGGHAHRHIRRRVDLSAGPDHRANSVSSDTF